jgi:DNA-binding FrmR family transcriptional regulator
MEPKVKQDAAKRLAKISGQVTGIQRMLDEDRYCVDILTQVSALRGALDQFGVLMLSSHLEDCVYGKHELGESDCSARTSEERLDELRLTLNRFLK